MNKLLNFVFIASCVMATFVTIMALAFGILACWLDLSREIIMDAIVSWYLSLIIFSITGLLSGYLKGSL